jgi:ribosomal protein S12 methylthiotransferase
VKERKNRGNLRVGLVSLGCPKARVDSEVILGTLGSRGFEVGGADETCDAIIINTCAFIEEAKVESIQEILEALELKSVNPGMLVYAAGCLPQRYPIELGTEIAELDGIYGVDELEKLVADVARDLTHGREEGVKAKLEVDTSQKPSWLYDHTYPRMLTTLPHYAYVKISEGCDHKCAFCTIPFIKGPYRSREVSSVVAEVDALAGMGVNEVNIISQDTTAFGSDTGSSIHRLLMELDKLTGPPWIRLLYLHPEKLDDEFLGIIRDSEKIVNYIDIPMQHVNGRILERMHRTTLSRDYLELVLGLRDFFGQDDVCLRTTLIVGFPGEGEDEFEQLAQFVADACFDRLTVFKFSREYGTEAWEMPDRVDDYEVDHRYHTLMNLQADVSYIRNLEYVGRTMRVLLEGRDDDGRLWGRSFRDAPEVDGVVFVAGEGRVGDFIDVEITEALDYDLVGRML